VEAQKGQQQSITALDRTTELCLKKIKALEDRTLQLGNENIQIKSEIESTASKLQAQFEKEKER